MPLILFGLFFSGSEKIAKAGDTIARNKSVSPEANVNVALQGAWTTSYNDEKGKEITITTIVMDGYLAETFYNVKTKEIIRVETEFLNNGESLDEVIGKMELFPWLLMKLFGVAAQTGQMEKGRHT